MILYTLAKTVMMKAIVLEKLGGVENFTLGELEKPSPGAGEVLIRIRATAFNPIDYQMRQGGTESKLLKSSILGRELSGEIVQMGEDVTGFTLGDQVTAYVGSLASNGTYAEYISVPRELIAKNPERLTFEEAAALPMTGMTAYQCFTRISIPEDAALFIAGGAGGVGTVLIKLLLAAGNQRVYTTAGNEESFSHLVGLGLPEDHIINYRQADLLSILRKKTTSETFDYVVDLVGGYLSEICAELINVYGTYVDVTSLPTEKARELLFDKATTVIHVANYAHAFRKDSLHYYGKTLKELFDRIERHELTPPAIHIVGNLSVETVQKAHLLMESNQTKGKKLLMQV